jgi:ATP/ADP translocase
MIAHRSRVFFLMFSITMLLNINFTILKSVRNTLAVVDLGIGASTIPIFELFGALPCSILMTWGLSLLMRISIHKVFLIAMAIFLGFFVTVHIPPPSLRVCEKNDSQRNFYFFLTLVLLICRTWIRKRK